MAARPSQPAALTIAGSDSSGGAGLQADLRTLARLGVHGASVVTCVTAQNPGVVSAIHLTPSKVVAAQLDSVFSSLPVRAVKTGMLYSRSIIDAVADCLAKRQRLSRVVGPGGGARPHATRRVAARGAAIRLGTDSCRSSRLPPCLVRSRLV